MKRYLVLLLAVLLVDQLVTPRPHHVAAPARPTHHFYMRCNVAVEHCRIA